MTTPPPPPSEPTPPPPQSQQSPQYVPPPYGQPPQQYAQPPYGQPGYGPSYPHTWMNIVALVTGLLCFGVVAVVFGHLGVRAANRDTAQFKGMGVAGLVLGYLGLAFWLAYLGVIAIAIAMAEPDAIASPQDPAPEPTIEFTDGWGASPTPPDPTSAEARTWTVAIDTNQGLITVELDGAAAPQAVASFVALAGDGFFNQTDCHRLVTAGIFVIQCGDPTGAGTGGPAYRFGPIENAPGDDFYPAGTLAMARLGGDGDSMGSQFFIVYRDSVIPSDAAGGYTVFGTVIDGLAIVDGVASAGTITGNTDGRPTLSVILNEVTVS